MQIIINNTYLLKRSKKKCFSILLNTCMKKLQKKKKIATLYRKKSAKHAKLYIF